MSERERERGRVRDREKRDREKRQRERERQIDTEKDRERERENILERTSLMCPAYFASSHISLFEFHIALLRNVEEGEQ